MINSALGRNASMISLASMTLITKAPSSAWITSTSGVATGDPITGDGTAALGGFLKTVTDDGEPVANGDLMRRALEYASMFDLTVISHCEDKILSSGGVMNEGVVSTVLGLPGIPAVAEEVIVARDIMLAELTGAKLHIAHVSTSGSVELIRNAKEKGIRVSAETAPHYFTLTEEDVRSFDTNFRVNPPLRTVRDLEAVKHGLVDGTMRSLWRLHRRSHGWDLSCGPLCEEPAEWSVWRLDRWQMRKRC